MIILPKYKLDGGREGNKCLRKKPFNQQSVMRVDYGGAIAAYKVKWNNIHPCEIALSLVLDLLRAFDATTITSVFPFVNSFADFSVVFVDFLESVKIMKIHYTYVSIKYKFPVFVNFLQTVPVGFNCVIYKIF